MDALELKWREYESVTAAFWSLAEIRFKLLAFVPTISGLGVGLMTKDLEALRNAPLSPLLVGSLGLVVTIGIIFYDQRNSQIYNALTARAKTLESEILNGGGQFHARPSRTLRFFRVATVWHDRGLALIYGSVVGAWVFPVACAAMWLTNVDDPLQVPVYGAGLAVVGAITVIVELHRLDRAATPGRTPKEVP